MSTRRTDAEILERARLAWPLLRGSEEEASRGAARVARRRRSDGVRSRRSRGFVPVLLGVGAAASLAWAASTWIPRSFERTEPVSGPSAALSASSGMARPARPVIPEFEPGLGAAPAIASSPPATAKPLSSGVTDRARGATEREPGWRAVDEALTAGDAPRAKRALEALAEAPDPTTRAKARLGLAQLALGRGDCDAVRRIASDLAASQAPPAFAKRAELLRLRCERSERE